MVRMRGEMAKKNIEKQRLQLGKEKEEKKNRNEEMTQIRDQLDRQNEEMAAMMKKIFQAAFVIVEPKILSVDIQCVSPASTECTT
uniref:BZIP domain-containing protein n=1 Tax=Caenorhabditis tropicalis TaxID=1561998 RepID=A0A1I7T352_9PELO